ncbi:MAG: SoxR reducing system RseC family protein [Negativicutes bacterium]|nr:SoxR reducing system RseC family protein [Negativicutes bacterium]
MEKSQEGIVLATVNGIAKVKVARHSSCENCGSCPGNTAAVLEARNPVDARPGQRVLLEMQQDSIVKAAFIVFILPLLGVFAGASGGTYLADALLVPANPVQIGGGIFGFTISLYAIRRFDRRARSDNDMRPVIIRILSE